MPRGSDAADYRTVRRVRVLLSGVRPQLVYVGASGIGRAEDISSRCFTLLSGASRDRTDRGRFNVTGDPAVVGFDGGGRARMPVQFGRQLDPDLVFATDEGAEDNRFHR